MRITRRWLLGLAGAGAASGKLPLARAFGDAGAFHPRLMTAGRSVPPPERASGAARWSWELIRRTSAPARLVVRQVAADRSELWAEPFAIWCGNSEVEPLSSSELRGLERFFRLGGLLWVDDADPGKGAFLGSARREIARVLPESPPVRLAPVHVLFKSYYLLKAPVGRVPGSGSLDAIVRGKTAQVIFSDLDLLGALARGQQGWALPVAPGGAQQREQALRLAVNLAMYVLCSDYKDDQVHADWLMRRRTFRR